MTKSKNNASKAAAVTNPSDSTASTASAPTIDIDFSEIENTMESAAAAAPIVEAPAAAV